MMKQNIVYIIDSLQTGGAEKSLLDITSRLKSFNPIFIQLFPGNDLLLAYQNKGIEVIQLNLKPSYRFKKIAKFVMPIINEKQPLLIHSTLFIADMVSRILSKKTSIPLINSLVNNSYTPLRYKRLNFIGKIKLKVIEYYDRITSKNVDLFISNSETIKKSNASKLKVDLEKIIVIYRGRDIKIFEVENEEVIKLKKDLNLENKKIILNVSRLIDRKGQQDLIKAYSNIVNQIPESVLLIAGEGPHRKILESEISQNYLENKIKLLGNRSDIPSLLKLADLFVFPTYYEGLPGALIEAIFSKRPIIATKIPENLECLKLNNALFFECGAIEDLSELMKVALTSYNSNKIEKAYTEAVDKFEIENVIKQYEKTYLELLK